MFVFFFRLHTIPAFFRTLRNHSSYRPCQENCSQAPPEHQARPAVLRFQKGVEQTLLWALSAVCKVHISQQAASPQSKPPAQILSICRHLFCLFIMRPLNRQNLLSSLRFFRNYPVFTALSYSKLLAVNKVSRVKIICACKNVRQIFAVWIFVDRT